mmetsp:Transcript_31956/g.71779  ORF Transcript_31956/g.71779 Transcript_31956/m.71779 type:complete len:236 (+) Transcript_31956:4044-4751(+)
MVDEPVGSRVVVEDGAHHPVAVRISSPGRQPSVPPHPVHHDGVDEESKDHNKHHVSRYLRSLSQPIGRCQRCCCRVNPEEKPVLPSVRPPDIAGADPNLLRVETEQIETSRPCAIVNLCNADAAPAIVANEASPVLAKGEAVADEPEGDRCDRNAQQILEDRGDDVLWRHFSDLYEDDSRNNRKSYRTRDNHPRNINVTSVFYGLLTYAEEQVVYLTGDLVLNQNIHFRTNPLFP